VVLPLLLEGLDEPPLDDGLAEPPLLEGLLGALEPVDAAPEVPEVLLAAP